MSSSNPFSIEYTINESTVGLDLFVKTNSNQKFFVNVHLPSEEVIIESGKIEIKQKICSLSNEGSFPVRDVSAKSENKMSLVMNPQVINSQMNEVKDLQVINPQINEDKDFQGINLQKIDNMKFNPHTIRFRNDQKVILNEWFEAHIQYPYLTDLDYDDLCTRTGLGKKQIRTYMTKKRVQLPRPEIVDILNTQMNEDPNSIKLQNS